MHKVAGRSRPSLLPYLAPEVLLGHRPRRSADVYAFGILMWELYTGVELGSACRLRRHIEDLSVHHIPSSHITQASPASSTFANDALGLGLLMKMFDLLIPYPSPTDTGRPAKPFTTIPRSGKGGVGRSNSTLGSGTLEKKLEWPDDVPLWYRGLAEICWDLNPKQRPSFRRLISAIKAEVGPWND